uniref:Caldesmon 1b n=1 Tax=Hippocampus comes TaxID=109280 RepID=A0A3Q2XKT5_HIPCM
ARLSRNDDDEEEAARERRRRARQERLRAREMEDSTPQPDSLVVTNCHSISVSSSFGGGEDEDQALLDRMARREERRQRRLKEALEQSSSWRREKTYSSWREEKEPEAAGEEEEEEEAAPEVEKVMEAEPRRSYSREEVSRLCLLHGYDFNNWPFHDVLRGTFRGSARSPEEFADQGPDDDDDNEVVRLEAERKLEELKRRREDAESEEFERMRQKQQESEAQLEELKRKREERRRVLEEEERQRKQEEAERKTREEEEKRKMKEEIERRRAEAAEKRQKVEEPVEGEEKPFKCVSPRGSSLKVIIVVPLSATANSAVKMSPCPVVSKIDNRLEQYTSAAQNKESRSPRSGAVDLPAVTDSIRNIKSMWEKGNVFSSPGSSGSAFKEAAVIKTGVAGRINEWLNKTPESGKASGGRPSDLKPVDVTNKRSLWENKGSSPAKVRLTCGCRVPTAAAPSEPTRLNCCCFL